MVKPPLASRPTEAVKFVEAVVVRLVALILLSRTEENLFEVVPRLFDEFFFLFQKIVTKHHHVRKRDFNATTFIRIYANGRDILKKSLSMMVQNSTGADLPNFPVD